MKFMRKLLVFALLVFSAVVVLACSTTVRTADMISEREVQYYFWDMNTGEEIFICVEPIEEGDTFVEIEGPSMPGYVFEGWYSDTASGYTKMTDGMALPSSGGIKVHANFVPSMYDINYYVDDVLVRTEMGAGSYEIDLQHMLLPSTYEIAQKLSQENGRNYNDNYLYFDGCYEDREYTCPLQNGTQISSQTDIYLKYDYVPVYTSYTDNGVVIGGVDEQHMEYVSGPLVIPSKTNYGDKIESIAENAFSGRTCLDEIVLSEGFTSIPDYAFANSSVTKITIPSSVESIGEGAFENCTSLTSAVINTTADFNVESVFSGCENLEYEEYGNCYYLGKYLISLVNDDVTEVQIRPICQEIPANFFAGKKIVAVKIPASVQTIGIGAFANCPALVMVVLESDIDVNIPLVFSGCNALRGEPYGNCYYIGKYLISLANPSATTVQFKASCTEIPANIFANSNITSVTIPANIKKIGENAFANTAITEIVIPATVEEVGDGAFSGCELLVDVTINTKAEFDFTTVFEGCIAIEGEEYGNAIYVGDVFVRPVNKDIVWAKIKPTCKAIPANAFKDCTRLSRVYVPVSVEKVGHHAFYNVNSLYFACYFEGKTNTIDFAYGSQETIHPDNQLLLNLQFYTMPQNVKLADNGIGYVVTNLRELTGLNIDGAVIYAYFGDAEEVTVEEKYDGATVGVIFQNVFMDNNTVKKVTIKACSVVGSAAFWNATAVEEIILPAKGCAQIGIRAFYGCTSLQKVTIGEDVVFIGMLAFEKCDALEEVKCANALNSWTSDAQLSQSYEANENIATALKSTELNNWFFNSVYTQELVEQVLASTGL